MLRTTVVHPAGPATSSQRPASGPLWNWISISALGSVNGKSWPEPERQASVSKKVRVEISEHHLQVLEADVLAQPQQAALVEHGRMCVAVHAVGALGARSRGIRVQPPPSPRPRTS